MWKATLSLFNVPPRCRANIHGMAHLPETVAVITVETAKRRRTFLIYSQQMERITLRTH